MHIAHRISFKLSSRINFVAETVWQCQFDFSVFFLFLQSKNKLDGDDETHVNINRKLLVKNKFAEVRLQRKKVHECSGTDSYSSDESANGHVVHCSPVTKFILYSYSLRPYEKHLYRMARAVRNWSFAAVSSRVATHAALTNSHQRSLIADEIYAVAASNCLQFGETI